jgi:hypothetical protein
VVIPLLRRLCQCSETGGASAPSIASISPKKERELTAAALRELAEVRYELAERDREEAFANAPSPSTSLH